MLYEIQSGFALLVFLVLLFVKGWATIDAILRPAQAYLAADKLNKTAWLWILGLTLVSHLLLFSWWLVTIAGTVAAFVYLLDVRPALVAVTRRR